MPVRVRLVTPIPIWIKPATILQFVRPRSVKPARRQESNFLSDPPLMNLRLMRSLSAEQLAGNTLVLGMPGGFLPLKNGKPNAPADPPAEN